MALDAVQSGNRAMRAGMESAAVVGKLMDDAQEQVRTLCLRVVVSYIVRTFSDR
jgi:hypothetical protein